jgi:AraC-like DNA-binding protein
MLKHRKIGDANASRLVHLLTELAKKISNSLGDSGERATEVPGLMLYRRTAPTVPNPSTYEPSLLVIAQGRIRVDLGKASYVFGQSRFLLTSLELPAVSQVITASEEAPYLAFFLKLDMSTVRDILNTEEVHIPEATSGGCGMGMGETTVELVNSCSRMMDLLDVPRDISFFGKLIQREIIYRLLQGSQGARLRAIATRETKCHRTAKTVAWLRSNYEKPLRVEHLATIAGMSRSTLHQHFRALTAMSPLQFQNSFACMPRGNACSRVNWMRQVRRSRSATKARANSIASTGDSLAGPQFAISRPCETAKSWRSLPLNGELLGCHGQLVLDCRKRALGP